LLRGKIVRIIIVDCVSKDDVADKYGMCLPTMDGSHLKDMTGHIMPSASNVKSAPSAKRSKYFMISDLYIT